MKLYFVVVYNCDGTSTIASHMFADEKSAIDFGNSMLVSEDVNKVAILSEESVYGNAM